MDERITSIVDHAMGMEQKFLEKRNWVEYIVRTANRELCTTEIERAKREEQEKRNAVYKERDSLVAALSKVFPAYLARHDENDKDWEKDWMWIVYISLPTGQVSWHIHDSELSMFSHLKQGENNWDGHTTEEKYRRLAALQAPDLSDKED